MISWPFLTKKELFLILFINVSINHLLSKYIFISVDSWILIISCIDIYSCSISIVNLTFSNLKRSFIALSVFSLLFFFFFHAFSPITSWQIDVETMETVTDFISLGSKSTADDDCSHEIKRRLPLGRKIITDLAYVLKSRDITLLTEVRIVKATVFPVAMYGCKSCSTEKAEHRRTYAFELLVVEKTLESPLGCKEIQPVHPKGNHP